MTISKLLLVLFIGWHTSFGQDGFECALPSGTGGITPRTGTVKAIIFYCVNTGEQDTLPTYFSSIPSLIEEYYERASFGQFHVQITKVIKRDSLRAIRGTINYTAGSVCVSPVYVCSDGFMRNVFAQADSLYDFGQYDNDGPDGNPNSGDDDGKVDFMFFWMLNYSARGVAGLYDLCNDYVTNDTSFSSGHGHIKITTEVGKSVECREDLRDVIYGAADYLGAFFHEGGHSLLNFPDMHHVGFTPYDHFSIGSYDPMANGAYRGVIGFDGVSSLYNPWFREQRGWVTPRALLGDSLNKVLTDFDSTGLLYKYSPSSLPPESVPINNYLISFHKKSPNNRWTQKWPIDDNYGGVMIWRLNKADVQLYDASFYSDRRKMPIDIEAGHGKFDWVDTTNTNVQNPLTGLDSIEIRNPTTGWYPYLHTAAKGVGSKSVSFVPNSGVEFAFYTNPTSNLYRNSSAENYGRSITSGFSIKNLISTSGTVRADFRINDYTVDQNATIHAGIWYVKGNIEIIPGVTLAFDGSTTLKFASGLTLTVKGNVVFNSAADVTLAGAPTIVVDSGGTITVQGGGSLTVEPGSTFKFANGRGMSVNGSLLADGSSGNEVTFTSLTTGGVWAGIIAESASSVTLEHTNISHCGTAISVASDIPFSMDSCTVDSVNVGVEIFPTETEAFAPKSITNSTFSNIRDIGILVNNFSDLLIQGNAITADSTVGELNSIGVSCISSSPQLLHNTVRKFLIGLQCHTASSPLLEDGPSGGYNIFSSNDYGVICDDESDAILGFMDGDEEGGMNSIHQNAIYDVQLTDHSFVLAENNWWGSDKPDTSQFSIESHSTLDYDPLLGYDPNSGGLRPWFGPQKKIQGGRHLRLTASSAAMREALAERSEGHYPEAMALLKSMVSDDSIALDVREWAVRQLLAVGQRMNLPDLPTFLLAVLESSPSLSQQLKLIIPYSYLHEGMASNAMSAFAANIQQFPNSDLEANAIYGKFLHALYKENDAAGGAELYGALCRNYAENAVTRIAGVQLQNYRAGMSGQTTTFARPQGQIGRSYAMPDGKQLPKEYALRQNYPNPFNPSTVINYDLPTNSNVRLTIYDVLGKEVETLVDGQESAGYHHVTFDGSTVASGMYFYRLTAGTFTDVKKLLLLK